MQTPNEYAERIRVTSTQNEYVEQVTSTQNEYAERIRLTRHIDLANDRSATNEYGYRERTAAR
eukprot:scaffold90613_cov63-Cyclotella_meneghiniana.AAC.1